MIDKGLNAYLKRLCPPLGRESYLNLLCGRCNRVWDMDYTQGTLHVSNGRRLQLLHECPKCNGKISSLWMNTAKIS